MVMQFGTWNVRIFLQAGNMNIIAEEAVLALKDI
jgi:hypothetical protein